MSASEAQQLELGSGEGLRECPTWWAMPTLFNTTIELVTGFSPMRNFASVGASLPYIRRVARNGRYVSAQWGCRSSFFLQDASPPAAAVRMNEGASQFLLSRCLVKTCSLVIRFMTYYSYLII